eukprot:6178414-Pleurochrysis_carterae.AAC.4
MSPSTIAILVQLWSLVGVQPVYSILYVVSINAPVLARYAIRDMCCCRGNWHASHCVTSPLRVRIGSVALVT